MRILAAFDKFRGTLTSVEACAAACAGAAGHRCTRQPIADGGEGTLDAFGGPNRWTFVTGPLGDPVKAGWRLADGVAVIEMAQASGLLLTGGHNDPIAASTVGVGQLIATALDDGAGEILVALGGSATTDGGWGAVAALDGELLPIPVHVACDVTTPFVDAAKVFGPQKGAKPADIALLTDRLETLAARYRQEYGLDVNKLPGAGAAGGLAGGLAALGATLSPGFGLVADHLGLEARVAAADLVLTGEGKLDDSSFHGKAVGGVVELAERVGTPVAILAGTVDVSAPGRHRVVSLMERFGLQAAMESASTCLRDATTETLRSLSR